MNELVLTFFSIAGLSVRHGRHRSSLDLPLFLLKGSGYQYPGSYLNTLQTSTQHLQHWESDSERSSPPFSSVHSLDRMFLRKTEASLPHSQWQTENKGSIAIWVVKVNAFGCAASPSALLSGPSCVSVWPFSVRIKLILSERVIRMWEQSRMSRFAFQIGAEGVQVSHRRVEGLFMWMEVVCGKSVF